NPIPATIFCRTARRSAPGLAGIFPMNKVFQTLRIIHIAFVSSSFIYLLIGYFLKASEWKPLYPSLPIAILIAFVLISVSVMAIAQRIKEALIKKGGQDARAPSFTLSRYVAVFALCEIPAILGFVYFFLTGI